MSNEALRIFDFTNGAHAAVYEDNANEFRWRIVAANNEIIGASSEGFASEQSAINNLKLIKTTLVELDIHP